MIKFFRNFEEKLIIIIFPIICVLVFISIITRTSNLFTQYFVWTEEAARYLMIWMAFLMIGVAAKNNLNFRLGALVENLPQKLQIIFNLIANIIAVSFMFVLVYYGSLMVLTQIRIGQLSPSMRIPIWIAYLSIPVGMLNMIIRTVIRVYQEMKYQREGLEKTK